MEKENDVGKNAIKILGLDKMKKSKVFFSIMSFSFIILLWKLYGIQFGVESLKEEIQLQSNIDHYPSELRSNPSTTVFCVTPTYWRYVQKAELIRILQVLTLASFKVNIVWIIIEDSEQKTKLVTNLLKRIDTTGGHFQYVHLYAKTPSSQKLKETDPTWKKHRGVEQRNKALEWIRSNLKPHSSKRIIFFMDDDNTYDVKLFEEIAKVENVGVWPVGLVGGLNVETPVLDSKTGKVTGYKSGWKPDRPFAIDMAGFGINMELILEKPQALFSYKMEKGYQESQFLAYFTTKEQLEPLAYNCTKVYVWHTRTVKPSVKGSVKGFDV